MFWEGGNEMKLGGNLVKGHDQPSSPNRSCMRRLHLSLLSTDHAFQAAVILSMHNIHIYIGNSAIHPC